MSDIDNPRHYTNGPIECIDAIDGMAMQNGKEMYHRGTVLKYLWRCFDKRDTLTDLKKARWFLDALIQKLEKGRKRPCR